MRSGKLQVGVVLSLLLAVLVMTGLALYADVPRMISALRYFHWYYLPLILGCTLFNYFWRFLKWQYYLHRLSISVDWRRSALIFLSGLSMALTPGKVGEVLKGYLLKQAIATPMSKSTPIIVAERLTDGIAMIGLAATGLLLYHFGWGVLLALLLVSACGIAVVQNRPLALWLLQHGEKLPVLSRLASIIRTFYESTYTLLQWRSLLLGIGIGLISWSGECVALYVTYIGLGVTPGSELYIKAMFIMAVSSLIGSVSGLPGGLGTADGSMVGLTRLLVSPSATLGGVATLLTRLCTLWFGLLVGTLAVLLFRVTQHTSARKEEHSSEAQKEQQAILLAVDKRLSGSVPASAPAHLGEQML